MRTRIGLAVARDAVRAVTIRHEQIVWAAEAPLESGAALETSVASLLAAAPVRRFARPVVSVAVGPHASQVRLVAGLPEGQDPETLAAIIKENVASFFLKNGVPLVTTGVRPMSFGAALAGAIDEPCVSALRAACAARRWRLGFIAPTPVVLVRAFEDGAFAWTDGAVVVEVSRAGATIDSVRTRPVCVGELTSGLPRPVAALARFGEHALRYADAYGAAVFERPPILSLDALTLDVWTRDEARRRMLAPSVILALGIASLVLSPLGAYWTAGRARSRLSDIRADQKQAVATALAQLDRVTAILDGMRRFQDSRAPVTPTLGALARAIPDGSILVSLELGDEQAELVALSANPGAVLAAVEHLPGARSVELAGPVRRETVAGREVQRVTVHWRRGER